MAKETKFNVRISVDGKEQLVTATSSVGCDLLENLYLCGINNNCSRHCVEWRTL